MIGSLLLCSLPLSLAGQTSASSGAIEGWVFDSSGGALGGAQVTAKNQQTAGVRTAATDEHGYFRVSDVPVGLYSLQVALDGFAAFEQKDITVNLGATLRVDAHLALATQVQQITVTNQAPLINPSDISITNSVGRERIEESPVRTRNALDFVLLEPNVVSTATQGTAAASTGLSASGFSFGGMRPSSNRIAIDGVENDDEFSGGSRTELSPEIVQEFQIVNNGISAEFGGASGGAVNVVTRSGANAMHGDAFVFLQNGGLNARPPVENAPKAPDLVRYRAGVANGGAIVHDRTFYYAAFEQEHQRSQSASDVEPGVSSLINAALAAGLYPGLPVRGLSTGFTPTARAETEASAKIDQQWSEHSSMSLRYAFTNNREAGDAFNNGGLTDAGGRGSSFLLDHSLVGSWTFIASPNLVNNLRVQVSRRHAVLRTNATTGPEIVIAGLVNFGQPYQGNEMYREDHADIADTYSWNRGRHLIQTGGALTYIHEEAVNRSGEAGLFVFAGVPDFLAGRASIYRQMFGNPNASFATPSYGGFVQDHWVANRHLTVDAGLRYDFERLPSGFHQDGKNFSPRFGIAFSPWSRFVLRAGYGIFFDRFVLASLHRSIIRNGIQGFEQVAEGAQSTSLFQRGAGSSSPIPNPGILPSVYRTDPGLATPYSQQASLGLQYAPAKNMTASANYLFVRGVRLARTRNVNLAPPALVSNQPVFSGLRLNPAFDGIYQLEDSASSTYHGLSLAFRVMKPDFKLDTSYTYSKAIDNASDYTEQPQNPYAARDDRALSSFDVRHRLVLSGLFDLPIGDDRGSDTHASHGLFVRLFSNIEIAPILTLESARPANPLTGIDSNGSQSYPLSVRPIGYGRNTLRTPPLATLDLRILKAIPMGESRRLDLVAESFNLLNHTNITAINPFFGSGPTPSAWFRSPTDGLSGRQLQFSIDFEF